MTSKMTSKITSKISSEITSKMTPEIVYNDIINILLNDLAEPRFLTYPPYKIAKRGPPSASYFDFQITSLMTSQMISKIISFEP